MTSKHVDALGDSYDRCDFDILSWEISSFKGDCRNAMGFQTSGRGNASECHVLSSPGMKPGLVRPILQVDQLVHLPLDTPCHPRIACSVAEVKHDVCGRQTDDQGSKFLELSGVLGHGAKGHTASLARRFIDNHNLSSVLVNLEGALAVDNERYIGELDVSLSANC